MPSAQAKQATAEPQPIATLSVSTARLLLDDSELGRWIAKRSHDVAAARAELEASRASERGTHLLPNPVVDVGVSNLALGRTDPPKLGLAHTLIYDVGLSELVELGKRGPRIAAAELRTQAAQGRVEGTLAERTNAARLALARELDESLGEAQKAAEVAKGRLDHQALSGVDYDRLLIDLVGIQTEAAHAHADAEAANAACRAALFAPCEAAEVNVATLSSAAPVPAQWNDAQLRERADIKSLQLESHAAKRDADLAAATAIPDLTFRLGYTRNTYMGNLDHSLGLSLAAPLPVFDHGQHAQAEALARASQYAAEARSATTQARGDVTALYTRKHDLEAALSQLEEDALPRANGVLTSEERGLLEGQLDITDLLLARRAAIGLRLQAIDLRFELFSIRNDLRRALGLDEALAQR